MWQFHGKITVLSSISLGTLNFPRFLDDHWHAGVEVKVQKIQINGAFIHLRFQSVSSSNMKKESLLAMTKLLRSVISGL